METKKDIGTALKDRLESFNDSPNDLVWMQVEHSLLKKKKKRRLIFWLFSIGLGITAFSIFIYLNNSNTSEIQDYNTIEKEVINQTVNSETNNQKDQLNSDKNNTSESIKDALNVSQYETSKNSLSTQQDKQNIRADKNSQSQNSKGSDSLRIHSKNRISYTSSKNSNKQKTNENVLKDKVLIKDPNATSFEKEYSEASLTKNKKLTSTKSNPKETLQERSKLLTNYEERKDNSIATKKDSLQITSEQLDTAVEKDSVSELLLDENKTKDSLNQNERSKWSISPVGTLSYYGAFGEKTSDNTSFNYGILVSYKLKDRLYLRTGIKSLNLNHTFSQDSLRFKNQVKYLEFPLEIKYNTNENNLSPYFTGGISYFSLQDATTNNENNPEYVSAVSINAGIGLEYKLSESLLFNLEPSFAYQLRPFRKEDNLNPFILSVNFGIIYRF